MYRITLPKENILGILAFDEKNAGHIEVLTRYAHLKRAVFLGAEREIKALILADYTDGERCFAVDIAPRSLFARLEKNLFLNL
ncbi:MAG: hypothetical protein LBT20_00810 [Clostridiales bacterium]|jgi:hypothetical protein|nr:hypothetical protein [Clostridiales bacterium]